MAWVLAARPRLVPVLVFFFAAGLLAILGIAAPDRYKLLLQEDGPIEWLTAICFVAAAVLATREACRSRRQRLDRTALGLIAAFCLLVAGEELSWGQRLFAFQPPELFLESNYQQEANLHNLLKGIFDSRWQVFTIACGYGVLAPLAAWRRWIPKALAPHVTVVPCAATVALLELSYPLELTGEVAELLLGICFVYDVTLRWSDGAPKGGRAALTILAGALLAAWVVGPLLDATLYRPDGATVAVARGELEALRRHLEGYGARPRLFSGRRIHKRIFTAIEAGYLTAPRRSDPSARDADEQLRRQYFLDPWRQPYWLELEPRSRGHALALLYSFGPNRRRDTLLNRLPGAAQGWTMQGDDVGMLFELRRGAAAKRPPPTAKKPTFAP